MGLLCGLLNGAKCILIEGNLMFNLNMENLLDLVDIF